MRALLLVGEDDARAIEALLAPLGYRVERADPATEVTASTATLVVADWDRLGDRAAARCRALAAPVTTLLVLRSDRSPAAIEAPLAAGASDVLSWPDDRARLLVRARLAAGRGASASTHGAAGDHDVIERAGDGFVTYRHDRAIVYANPAFCEFLGYTSREELRGHGLDLVHADDQPIVRERLRALGESGPADSPVTLRFLARDGSIRLAEARGVGVMHEGAPAVTVTVRPLAARHRADEALRLSEERFYKIFRNNPASITITRLSDDTFVDVNDSFLAATGFVREEVIGRTGVELGLWQTPTRRRQLDDSIRAGRKVRDVEVRLRKKSGQPLDLLMSLETLSVGGEECVFALSYDVTERKQLEQQLRHAQKMDAIGRLAGGVAHDFNNLLTAIRGFAQLLLDQLPPDGAARDAAHHIQRSAVRASSLTSQLLAFTRRQPHQPRVVELNDVVGSMGALLRRVIGEDIELALVLQPDLGFVRVDPGQVEQVLLNLAINARDAMAQGGRLSIATSNVDDNDGAHVRLTVRDSGTGMNEETRLRIFEPFFTTKEVGKGTGLGLSIVYGVVVQNGGSISVDTAPGAGTTFHVLLPRVDGPVEAEPTTPLPRSPSQRGRETILLVEDDEDVRDFVHYVLRAAGYDVLPAANGSAALAIAESHAGPIHLLLSDVVMPQMNGVDLAERLLPLRPAMRVVHMSGYPGERIARHGQMPAGVPFLQKPFSAEALNGIVR
ncbi:MAG: domain S-box protein, partial [bacterium]|nr:domain S-box protein [bacterium]